MGKDIRAEQRAPVAHEFNVFHESFGVKPGKSRDLSISGIFVEGDFTGLSVGTSLGLSFELPSTLPLAADKTYQLSAIVVRVTSEGAGLKLIPPDMETSSALVKLKDSI